MWCVRRGLSFARCELRHGVQSRIPNLPVLGVVRCKGRWYDVVCVRIGVLLLECGRICENSRLPRGREMIGGPELSGWPLQSWKMRTCFPAYAIVHTGPVPLTGLVLQTRLLQARRRLKPRESVARGYSGPAEPGLMTMKSVRVKHPFGPFGSWFRNLRPPDASAPRYLETWRISIPWAVSTDTICGSEGATGILPRLGSER